MRNENANRKPVLWVDPIAWAKIHTYVRLCPQEVNGFAYIRPCADGDFLLVSPDDVFITNQLVTPGSADVDEYTVGRAQYRASLDRRVNELRFQWHSHVHGAAYHSDTDMDTINGYGEAGAQWMVSAVFNKRGEYTVRLDVYTPLRVGIELEVKMYHGQEGSLGQECMSDISAHVKRKVYVLPEGFEFDPEDGDADQDLDAIERQLEEVEIGIFEPDPPNVYRRPARRITSISAVPAVLTAK